MKAVGRRREVERERDDAACVARPRRERRNARRVADLARLHRQPVEPLARVGVAQRRREGALGLGQRIRHVSDALPILPDVARRVASAGSGEGEREKLRRRVAVVDARRLAVERGATLHAAYDHLACHVLTACLGGRARVRGDTLLALARGVRLGRRCDATARRPTRRFAAGDGAGVERRDGVDAPDGVIDDAAGAARVVRAAASDAGLVRRARRILSAPPRLRAAALLEALLARPALQRQSARDTVASRLHTDIAVDTERLLACDRADDGACERQRRHERHRHALTSSTHGRRRRRCQRRLVHAHAA